MRHVAKYGDGCGAERPMEPAHHQSWQRLPWLIVVMSVGGMLVAQPHISAENIHDPVEVAYPGASQNVTSRWAGSMGSFTQARAPVDFDQPFGDVIMYQYEGSRQGEVKFHLILPDQKGEQAIILACDEHLTCAPEDLAAEGTDTDGDGILDDVDACPASDLRTMVILDGCTSGVENILFEDGCTLADLLQGALASGGEAALAELLAGLQEEGIAAEEVEAIAECVASSGEIADDEPIKISYRFYTAKDGGRARLNSKPEWVKAIEWWIERYNKHCQPEGYPAIVGAVDLGDVINAQKVHPQAKEEEKKAAKADAQYYMKQNFATEPAQEAKHQGEPRWVVGQDELADFVSTSYADSNRVFHIGLFNDVYSQSSGWTHGIWYPGTNMSAVRATLVHNVQKGQWHEMGHLFGLDDNTGGVMSKPDNKSYGDPDVWGKHWCKTIATHLGIAKAAAGGK